MPITHKPDPKHPSRWSFHRRPGSFASRPEVVAEQLAALLALAARLPLAQWPAVHAGADASDAAADARSFHGAVGAPVSRPPRAARLRAARNAKAFGLERR